MSFLNRFLTERQDSEVTSSEEISSGIIPEISSGTIPETSSESRDYSLPLSADMQKYIKEQIVTRMREVYDPEIPVDIYEMGLIYEINVAADGRVEIIMTLTSPHCPVAESMPGDVQIRAQDVEGVQDVNVELVWDPPWTIYMMSEAARLEMGFM